MKKSIFSEEHVRLIALLKQIRIDAGLTQVELAERLKTSHSRISDYERGERRMDLVQLKEYCGAVGITLRDLVDRFDPRL